VAADQRGWVDLLVVNARAAVRAGEVGDGKLERLALELSARIRPEYALRLIRIPAALVWRGSAEIASMIGFHRFESAGLAVMIASLASATAAAAGGPELPDGRRARDRGVPTRGSS